MRRGVLLSVVFLFQVFSVACSGGGGGSNTGSLRFVQGSPDAPAVDFLVDGKTQTSDMLYANSSDYISLKPGSRHVQVIPVNGSTPLLDQTVSVGSSDFHTLLLTGPVAQLKPVLLTDTVASTTTTPVNNVRVISVSTQMGPADVYVVAPGVNLATAAPVFTNLTLSQDSGYQAITGATGAGTGSYQVFVTAPGTRNAYLNTGPLAVASGKNQTVVIEDSPSGGFTFTVLQDQ